MDDYQLLYVLFDSQSSSSFFPCLLVNPWGASFGYTCASPNTLRIVQGPFLLIPNVKHL